MDWCPRNGFVVADYSRRELFLRLFGDAMNRAGISISTACELLSWGTKFGVEET